jgi:hypothetical protein
VTAPIESPEFLDFGCGKASNTLGMLSAQELREATMFVSTQPAALTAAYAGLQGIGSAMMASNAAAATPTTAVSPPASDPTSALLAAAFGVHGGVYQAVAGVANAFHEMFAATMAASSGSYAATEAINAIAAT